MSSFISKIKLVFSKFFSKKISYKKRGLRPGKDWKIILVTTQVLLILIGIIAFYFYIEVDSGRLFVLKSEPGQSETKINTELLKKIVSDLSSREEKLIQIKVGKIIPPDPSL